MAPSRNVLRLATLPSLLLTITSAMTFGKPGNETDINHHLRHDFMRLSKVIEDSSADSSAISSTAQSPLENGADLSDDMGGTYQFQMRLLDNGVGVWKDGGDRGAQGVPDELKGATLFAGTMDQVWQGSLYVKAKFAGYVYVFGEPKKTGGITKLFWKQVGSFRWQGSRDTGVLTIYKTAMRKDSIIEIPITSMWNGGVAFKKDENAQAVANAQRTDGAFGKGKQQVVPVVTRGGFRKDQEQLKRMNVAMSFSYYGCMSNSRLVVSHKKDDPLAMSVERCFLFCSTWGSTVFFGLENGRKCWCAAVFYGDKLEEGQCDQACFGSPEQKCGGAGGVASVHMMYNCNTQKSTTTAKPTTTATSQAQAQATTKATTTKRTTTTTTQKPKPQVFYTEAEMQTCGGQPMDLLQRRVGGHFLGHVKAPIALHAGRLAKLLQSSRGPKTRAAKFWEAGGTRVLISGSETMIAKPKACKKACSTGDARYACGGFTYDFATSKCTFLLSATEGNFYSGEQFICFTKNFPDEDDEDEPQQGQGQQLR